MRYTFLKYKLIVLVTIIFCCAAYSQVENVPLQNQVYEFFDRLSVQGLLPHYSNTMLPISRKEVGEMLRGIISKKEQLSPVEKRYLEKFLREFSVELSGENDDVSLFSSEKELSEKVSETFSNKEKYIYEFQDSSVSLYAEFLGSFEERAEKLGSTSSRSVQLFQYGGRVRGTFKQRLGFAMQSTNGSLYGSRSLALEDPVLRTNYKINEPNSNNFDFTEGYVRADLDWLNIEFCREFTMIGTGYSDKLILSKNSPIIDALKINAEYKSFKFLFMHGLLSRMNEPLSGLDVQQFVTHYTDLTKYISLHRFQFNILNSTNIGFSEMIIYQRSSPDFGYLNPVAFYKSVEHSENDLDNAFITLDAETYCMVNYKIFGALLIDDVSFSKIGSGWWGNEIGWQAGIYRTDLFLYEGLDADIEYTRINPYVYSHHIFGNSYSNYGENIGHHLQPNSDEVFVRLNYRESEKLRLWCSIIMERHGENIYDANGNLLKNSGGNVLEGHRFIDSDNAIFLNGNLHKTFSVQLKSVYEPINNFFVIGLYEWRNDNLTWLSQTTNSNYLSVQLKLEY